MTNDQWQMSNKYPMPNGQSGRFDIYERCLGFAVKISAFVDKLPKRFSSIEYGKQLLRSSASIGANMQEADGALTKKDFINKVGIARREAKETNYWLQLLKYSKLADNTNIDYLLQESKEIKLILSSIINNTRRNMK